jgi:hypothetical protein
MSKKCKAASKQKRLQKKRALKAANIAKYESWRNSGQNSKSARARKKSRFGRSPGKGLHITFGFCGNPACTRCFNTTDLFVYAYRK